jgi:hypothetical protein
LRPRDPPIDLQTVALQKGQGHGPCRSSLCRQGSYYDPPLFAILFPDYPAAAYAYITAARWGPCLPLLSRSATASYWCAVLPVVTRRAPQWSHHGSLVWRCSPPSFTTGRTPVCDGVGQNVHAAAIGGRSGGPSGQLRGEGLVRCREQLGRLLKILSSLGRIDFLTIGGQTVEPLSG